jgi:L,D-transpeptidase catalytic domain
MHELLERVDNGMPGISRRDFLKLTGAAVSTLAFSPLPNADNPPPGPLPALGRATWPLYIYARPSFLSKRLGGMRFDDLFTIRGQANGDSFPHNPVWFRIDTGWVQSSSVQVVRYSLNKPVLDVRPDGFLAEVTVPMTPSWVVPGQKRGIPANFYYSSVFWVEAANTDASGQVWYRLGDDFHVDYYVAAEHLRPIPDDELTPLSPEVLDKRIEINLTRQRLLAYENGQPVFTCKVASGLPGTETPGGVHRIRYKRPSRHMATGMDVVGPEYNLPGVPWCSYFTESGAALHGTYWHNDFGRRNSAGCVNLTPANAKRLYRWTLPAAAYNVRYLAADTGTKLIVF